MQSNMIFPDRLLGLASSAGDFTAKFNASICHTLKVKHLLTKAERGQRFTVIRRIESEELFTFSLIVTSIG